MPAAVGQPLATVTRLPHVGLPETAPAPTARQAPAVDKCGDLLRSVLVTGDPASARQRLVDALAVYLTAERVALGWRVAGHGPWQAVMSGQGSIERRSEPGRALAAACAEAALGADIRCWQPPASAPPALRQLAGLTGARSATAIPLTLPGQAPRSVLLVLDSGEQNKSGTDVLVAELAPALAGLAQLCDQATPTHAQCLSRSVRGYFAGRRKLSSVIAAGLLAIIFCVPVPNRVSCTAILEPCVRRFVGAPFDGKLETALVKVGDAVVAGQTLALLDRRPLEMELSVLQAQLDETLKRRDAFRAKGQAAQTQLAELEVAQLERKVEQLNHQLGQLTVVSPITGIVVRGELQRVVGAPLARGQNLFEIAPLTPLIAEVAVPEDEVRLVSRGASVMIRPLALAGHSLRGQIDQLHPRAEARDGQTVFIAEVALPNEKGRLRPGMQARATISGPRQPLAWTIVRRPLTRLYRALWW